MLPSFAIIATPHLLAPVLIYLQSPNTLLEELLQLLIFHNQIHFLLQCIPHRMPLRIPPVDNPQSQKSPPFEALPTALVYQFLQCQK